MFFSLAILPLTLWLTYRLYRLLINYRAARNIGIPVIILPVSFEEPWWMLLRPYFAWVERLPLGLGDWYIYTNMGWPQEDNARTSKRLGENFVLCSPVRNVIATAYPLGIETTFGNWRRWHEPDVQSQLFVFYGQNVSSLNGAEWQRHRKITASAFNEATFRGVWEETRARAENLGFEKESERSLRRIRTTVDIVAMQVLANVAFGQDTDLTTVAPGHRQSMMESLGFMLKHVLLTVVFHSLKAPDFLLPKQLRKLKVSVAEFKMYMEESVAQHKQESNETLQASLLGAMIKANEAEKQQLQKKTTRPSYLTDSELYGNIFVFNMAGYETTASSFTFALSYLAAYPKVQEWVVEEVDKYCTGNPNNVSYNETFPKMVRTLSIMHEVLRVASPAPMLIRTPTEPTELPIMTKNGPKTVVIKPGEAVGGDFYGAHLSERWGEDAEIFNPKRFISRSPSGEEALVIPQGPMYCPFLFGGRVCPGRKFSQVEFVALLSQILSKWRIEVADAGKTPQTARDDLMKAIDGKYFNISTHVRYPDGAGIKFVRR